MQRAGATRASAVLVAGAALLALVLAFVIWNRYLPPSLRLISHAEPAREPVPGDNSPPAPRVAPELEQLDPAGLEMAARYAGEHRSRALIVSRHEHIVFERYWQGTGFDTPADAQSFTRLLAALAAGAAMSQRLIAWPDEPIGAFIGEWSHDPRGEITVRNLLQMSSGLGAPSDGGTRDDLAAALLRTPPARTPGATRVDQATDPQLLALDRPGGTAHADCCMLAHQGDWIRVAQLLLRDGNYRGDEVIRPGWVTLMRTPAQSDPLYGAYLRVRWQPAANREMPAARDLFAVTGEGGNRLWVVPSLQIAIVCTGPPEGRDAAWDDNHLPNLIVHAARDALPAAAQPGADISSIVPGH